MKVAQWPPELLAQHHRNGWHNITGMGGTMASGICRKQIRIAPRTLQRYLKELHDYNRLKIVGGKKHGNGYQYELNPEPEHENLPGLIEEQISKVLKAVEAEHKERQGTGRKRKK
jgi:hypothetical protein